MKNQGFIRLFGKHPVGGGKLFRLCPAGGAYPTGSHEERGSHPLVGAVRIPRIGAGFLCYRMYLKCKP
jgi:hypothetical protein